ncbi:phosphomevalonate kinase, partial [Streptococcus suis]
MKVQVKIPGKLFLAGDYAVVEAGYPAVIAAVDQYLTVTIETRDRGL